MENGERFIWALEIMQIKGGDNVLEIGCGVGMSVELIAAKLKDGRIVAIDRSQSMIDKAMKRNDEYLKNGKVRFSTSELTTFSSNHLFDKIFCFNVNLFWTKKSVAPEVKVIRTHLSGNGSFYTFFGPMFAGGHKKIVDPVRSNLEQEAFQVLDIIHEKKNNCCCFISRPK